MSYTIILPNTCNTRYLNTSTLHSQNNTSQPLPLHLTPMAGHPFKYKDDAERAQAVHEYHIKYYKLNKRAICEKNNIHHANRMAGNVQSECTTKTATMKACPTSKTSNSQIVIVPESKQTTRMRSKTQLSHVLAHLEEVQVGLRGLEGSVLEEMGMSSLYKECKKTITAIEELWCYGTSGVSGIPDLAERRREGDLLYETLFDKIPINNHSKFLQSVYEIWFAQWPEHDVYPGDTHREEKGSSLSAIALTLPDVLELTWTCIPSSFEPLPTCSGSPQYNGSTKFWLKINWKFFMQWPVHKTYYPDVDNEDELTEEQKEVYKTPLQT
ncbi:uncharacterized protein EDB91DRAFT_1085715 [Suillus paluster]|uniref:uncharacterized protein n=1 Tax=Suillus paluster TaxID=48578 RepID=UPI001B880BDE|nr:uncharacterized protein EDB91DRAFT_1085715 [Suillus paluster]KAG1729492.1 hypothetical protein EDB91DRAFT_1085715 [Suillus paluster]